MVDPIRFEIVPHNGIGPVRLGMLPAEVESVLATLSGALPRRDKSRFTHCYFGAHLRIEFGDSGRAQFIGVSNHPKLLCMFHGRDVFDTAAPDLFAFIASKEQHGPHSYSPLEYLFPEQIIALYEADEQYDRKGDYSRPVFGEVGVGNDEYIDAIRNIRDGPAAS